jgi:hypothetical protein
MSSRQKKKQGNAVDEAAKLKNEGNTFYAALNYTKAIECYTKAYNLQPSKSYSNFL